MRRRESKHHWGRYAVVVAGSLAALPLLSVDAAWATITFLGWSLLMNWFYWEWVRKD